MTKTITLRDGDTATEATIEADQIVISQIYPYPGKDYEQLVTLSFGEFIALCGEVPRGKPAERACLWASGQWTMGVGTDMPPLDDRPHGMFYVPEHALEELRRRHERAVSALKAVAFHSKPDEARGIAQQALKEIERE